MEEEKNFEVIRTWKVKAKSYNDAVEKAQLHKKYITECFWIREE